MIHVFRTRLILKSKFKINVTNFATNDYTDLLKVISLSFHVEISVITYT